MKVLAEGAGAGVQRNAVWVPYQCLWSFLERPQGPGCTAVRRGLTGRADSRRHRACVHPSLQGFHNRQSEVRCLL